MTRRLLSARTLERVAVLDVAARRATGGGRMGERSSGAAGIGTIFREDRVYSPGDDLRYVDWNVYGRLRSLHVKVFDHEENLDLHLLVDGTASMGSGPSSKLEAGLRVAGMIGAAALARGDVVRVGAAPRRGVKSYVGGASTSNLLDTLQGSSSGASQSLYDMVRAAMPRVRRRGLALLVTDFLEAPEAWRRAVDYLCHVRVELTCIHVVSLAERDPSAAGPLRLTDVETGAVLDIDVDDELLAAYRQRFDRRLREVRAYLSSKQARHVLVDASRAGETDLLRQLLREGVLR